MTHELEVERVQMAGKLNVFGIKPSKSLPLLKF